MRRRTIRRNFRTGFLCQYESSPLQLQSINKTERENTCMLSDIPDERISPVQVQKQMDGISKEEGENTIRTLSGH